ncbi:DUF6544 family protein [Jidongwangia harbinensis]|uniref:DUF6544 family protein n=1 Tax=Jidongwangia harbinensis TaxID=2878561 RepID=UPI001CD9E077|nr:DUF6544 family protein [Jidongwangia harbinensis]MCA2216441.1 hypothetical protein [Jidongwangia harbinensis]
MPIDSSNAGRRAVAGMPSTVPRCLTDDARSDWADLRAPTLAPALFHPDMTANLPEPARRWVLHAIAPGTPMLFAVELASHGRIRLGGWRSFAAVQRTSATRGFVWAATASMFGMPVVGFDRYSRHTGQMRWRAFGAVPVTSAAGPEVTRSAAGRHAGELLISLPAAALSPQVKWRAMDAGTVAARIKVDSGFHEVVLSVSAGGALTSVAMSRWGASGRSGFRERPFGADLGAEASFDGFTIPTEVSAGWEHATDGSAEGRFIAYTVDSAAYR